MNTLKLKVLLFISNRSLHRAVGKSVLIWFLTNLIGCSVLYGLGFFFLQSLDEFIKSLGLSLIFSSPAVAIAACVLYSLPSFNTIFKRAIVSLASIVATSVIIILIVSRTFQLEYLEVMWVLYPFVLAAIVCFFSITRKQFIPLKTLIN